jgi:hypothetical protein
VIRDWLLSPVAKKDNYGRRADGGCRGLSQYTIKMTLPRREGVWKSIDVNPRIINFKIRCRRMVSFSRRPLYLWGKSPLRTEQEDQWDAESFSTPSVVQPVA